MNCRCLRYALLLPPLLRQLACSSSQVRNSLGADDVISVRVVSHPITIRTGFANEKMDLSKLDDLEKEIAQSSAEIMKSISETDNGSEMYKTVFAPRNTRSF